MTKIGVPDKAGLYHWHCTALPIDDPLPAWLATFGGSRVAVSIIECEAELIAYVPGVQGSVPIERLTTLGEWGPRIPEVPGRGER